MNIKELAKIINIYIDKGGVEYSQPYNKYYILVEEVDIESNIIDDLVVSVRKKANIVINNLLSFKFLSTFEIDIYNNNNKILCYVRGKIDINEFINDLNK